MSCIKLPSSLCSDLESLMAKFYWVFSSNGRKVHWKSWKSICKVKRNGGLGFRSFIAFNQVLIAKQAWRILSKLESLLAKVFKARYFPRSSIVEAQLGYNPSYAWRSILWGKELLSQGIRWRVGDGTQISCFTDPWIPAAFSSHDLIIYLLFCPANFSWISFSF